MMTTSAGAIRAPRHRVSEEGYGGFRGTEIEETTQR